MMYGRRDIGFGRGYAVIQGQSARQAGSVVRVVGQSFEQNRICLSVGLDAALLDLWLPSASLQSQRA